MWIRILNQFSQFCTKASSSCYITTPIFYANAPPHIGHLYSAVIADAMSGYKRLIQPKNQLHFCTGTDEHGTKVQQAAATQGKHKTVKQYCDDISMQYRMLFIEAGVAYTDFIRTTEERHKNAATHFWRKLNAGGHLYRAQYSGWYCISDETFLTDKQLRLDPSGACLSAETGHPVAWTEETNYMFKLSKFQEQVLYWVKQGNRIQPVKFEKILLDMLNEPLPDLSVSRPTQRVNWAIPVPDDERQTIYVWLDALINYLSSVGYPDEKYRTFWPPTVQVIGKDILKFHGIYWPAFLIAAGMEPPKQLYVHSHWTVDGQKMSKSKQNVVNPQEAAKIYTMEGLRYFLLREGVAHSDGNYSSVKALRILNSELADTLGNLLSRCCAKSLNPRQIFPQLHPAHIENLLQMDAARKLEDAVQQLEARCREHYDKHNFYLVVNTVMTTLHAANNFFESARPWELKSVNNSGTSTNSTVSVTGSNNENPNHSDDDFNENTIPVEDPKEKATKLETIIAMTMDTLRLCGIVLQPIVPQLSRRLLDKLSVPLEERLWCNLKENFANKNYGERYAAAEQKQVRQLSIDDSILFRRIILKELPTAAAIADEMTKMQDSSGKQKSAKTRSKKVV